MATAQPHGGLLGLDAQLLLGVLALLDPAQLALALGEPRGGGLTFALGLHLAAAQVGEMGLQRVHRRLRRLRTTGEGRAGEPRAAGAALGQRVAFALLRGATAKRLVLLGYHRSSEYGRART